MEVYHSDASHREKADRSPVTIADERAEALICARLQAAAPGVPIVAEEAVSAGIVPPELGSRFFLVDPLDGTKEFIHRRTDFTV
ncbi:MAG TPA: inositol monophosphatase family protein, partial [Pararhizobium sp.]|nr:inositol monophosphatase family protein [Pararhizobium sp.]